MPVDRLLFARPRREATIAPIYVAILSLVSLGLLAFIVVMWPDDPKPTAPRPGEAQAAPVSRSLESGQRLPQDPRESRRDSRWM